MKKFTQIFSQNIFSNYATNNTDEPYIYEFQVRVNEALTKYKNAQIISINDLHMGNSVRIYANIIYDADETDEIKNQF